MKYVFKVVLILLFITGSMSSTRLRRKIRPRVQLSPYGYVVNPKLMVEETIFNEFLEKTFKPLFKDRSLECIVENTDLRKMFAWFVWLAKGLIEFGYFQTECLDTTYEAKKKCRKDEDKRLLEVLYYSAENEIRIDDLINSSLLFDKGVSIFNCIISSAYPP